MSLLGKVAIITGSSRGIGEAIAYKLADEKANIVINYLSNKDKATTIAKNIINSGGQAITVQADVSKADDVKRLFNETSEKFGRLDILINNAGMTHLPPITIANATEEIYDNIFETSAKGTFLCLRESAKYMCNGGRIINMSSTGVIHAYNGYGIYTAAKSAVEVFTRVFAKEMRGRNITVNCIAPGGISTDDWLKGKTDEILKHIAGLSPLNRLGTPEDIANIVALLASKQSEWINGQIIRLNGGMA